MVMWDVTFDPATQSLLTPAERAQLLAGTLAAAEIWGRYLDADGVTLSIVLEIIDTPDGRASAASVTSGFVETVDGVNIFQDGAGFELRTGTDPNGAEPDIRIIIDPDFFRADLFIDPDPEARISEVDPNLVDLQSVLLHEIGHGLGINGFSANNIFSLPSATDISPYEDNIILQGEQALFNGPSAVSVYGAAVPLTTADTNNAAHLGNPLGQVGDDLIPTLMNGVVFFRGVRYEISPLTTAILDDSLVPIRAASSSADILYGYEVIDPALADAVGGTALAFLFGEDVISALGGDDEVYGLSGDDTIDGGSGGDTLVGGLGNDLLIGGDGNDLLVGDGGVA
ncbi:MAG: calcium-binding protein [Pseudomonadota bacterium]